MQSGDPNPDGQAGYNLVVMVIVITIVNVMVATALPLWSSFAQREREEELIFRGLQYAEAIRVFQKRFGRYPNRIEELVELEPRCLRQLWEDPMSEDGKWGFVYGGGQRGRNRDKDGKPVKGDWQQAGAPTGLAGGDPRGDEDPAGGDGPSSGSGPAQGQGQPGVGRPITGVFSKSDESGFKTFFGQSSYREWRFTSDLVSQPPMGPTGVRTPHIGPRTLGRAFAGEIGEPGAGVPGAKPTGLPGNLPGKGQSTGIGSGAGPADPPSDR